MDKEFSIRKLFEFVDFNQRVYRKIAYVIFGVSVDKKVKIGFVWFAIKVQVYQGCVVDGIFGDSQISGNSTHVSDISGTFYFCLTELSLTIRDGPCSQNSVMVGAQS